MYTRNNDSLKFLFPNTEIWHEIFFFPVTTLHPNLGEILYPDSRKVTLADLPGLIEGAWKNQGLGHSFLRHVERTKILMFVIDVDGFRLSPEYPKRSAFENFLLLNRVSFF